MPRASATAAVIAVLLAIGCGHSPSTALPVQTRPSPVAQLRHGAPSHIAVIVMENTEYGDVIGNKSAPYINGLSRGYALATGMYAVSHPSLPNYLALTGGSTFGIDTDCTDCSVSGPSIASQLQAKGLDWRAYMEDLPHPCFSGAGSGGYAKKHDPFVYYHGGPCNVVPLTYLAGDERSGKLPRYLWISPNLCHDMHDCDIATGDRFLSRLMPPLLRALGPRGVLFLTWDEGSSDSGCCRLAAGGHIATIVAGGLARRGARLRTPTDHYSMLQTIDDLLGLTRLRNAACACTPSLRALLTG